MSAPVTHAGPKYVTYFWAVALRKCHRITSCGWRTTGQVARLRQSLSLSTTCEPQQSVVRGQVGLETMNNHDTYFESPLTIISAAENSNSCSLHSNSCPSCRPRMDTSLQATAVRHIKFALPGVLSVPFRPLQMLHACHSCTVDRTTQSPSRQVVSKNSMLKSVQANDLPFLLVFAYPFLTFSC